MSSVPRLAHALGGCATLGNAVAQWRKLVGTQKLQVQSLASLTKTISDSRLFAYDHKEPLPGRVGGLLASLRQIHMFSEQASWGDLYFTSCPVFCTITVPGGEGYLRVKSKYASLNILGHVLGNWKLHLPGVCLSILFQQSIHTCTLHSPVEYSLILNIWLGLPALR